MKKLLVGFGLALSMLSSPSSYGAVAPVLWEGSLALVLPPGGLDFNRNAYFLTGSSDPTSVAQSAPKGSLYLRYGSSGGALYTKSDNGLSTNWTAFVSGSAGVSSLSSAATQGGLSITGTTLDAKQASGSQNGWLSSTDFTNFSQAVSQFLSAKNGSATITLQKGQVVYVNGFDAGTGNPAVSLASAASPATMPGIGLMAASCAPLATCSIQVQGVLTAWGTAALVQGQPMYVSDSSPGSLASVQPVSPSLAQSAGVVVNSNASGSAFVVLQQPDQIQNGTRNTSFSIGANTGNPQLQYKSTFLGTLTDANLTAPRTWTLPDATGTVALTNSAQTFTGIQNFSSGASGFTLRDPTDTTKHLILDLSTNSTSATTTLKSNQSTSQTFSLPNISATDSLAALGAAQEFTNTLVDPRINNASAANSITPNWALYDTENITLTSGTAFTISNHTGVIRSGQTHTLCITALAGGAVTYTFGNEYVGSVDLALMATGGAASKADCVLLKYDPGSAKVRQMSYNRGF